LTHCGMSIRVNRTMSSQALAPIGPDHRGGSPAAGTVASGASFGIERGLAAITSGIGIIIDLEVVIIPGAGCGPPF
jgi:hypothetical protein